MATGCCSSGKMDPEEPKMGSLLLMRYALHKKRTLATFFPSEVFVVSRSLAGQLSQNGTPRVQMASLMLMKCATAS